MPMSILSNMEHLKMKNIFMKFFNEIEKQDKITQIFNIQVNINISYFK